MQLKPSRTPLAGRGCFCPSFLDMDLPMTVGMRQLQVVRRVQTVALASAGHRAASDYAPRDQVVKASSGAPHRFLAEACRRATGFPPPSLAPRQPFAARRARSAVLPTWVTPSRTGQAVFQHSDLAAVSVDRDFGELVPDLRPGAATSAPTSASRRDGRTSTEVLITATGPAVPSSFTGMRRQLAVEDELFT